MPCHSGDGENEGRECGGSICCIWRHFFFLDMAASGPRLTIKAQYCCNSYSKLVLMVQSAPFQGLKWVRAGVLTLPGWFDALQVSLNAGQRHIVQVTGQTHRVCHAQRRQCSGRSLINFGGCEVGLESGAAILKSYRRFTIFSCVLQLSG